MKQWINIAVLGILILNSCSNSEEYTIEKHFRTVVDNENCKIAYHYPKFISNDPKVADSELNTILEKYTDCEYYARGCDEKRNEKTIIKGDFTITMKTKDKLSIEFLTEMVHFGGNRMDTVYHSIVLNPQKVGDKGLSFIHQDPKRLIPGFNRGDLYKYVEEYNLKNQRTINLLAYTAESKYEISWGISKDDFLLYVGGEGEWFGYDKIRIPIEELIK